jgi:Uri superfamily endonuclease
MKYAVEMSSGAMIYIKTGSGIQKFMGRIYRHTDSMLTSQASFNFFKIR